KYILLSWAFIQSQIIQESYQTLLLEEYLVNDIVINSFIIMLMLRQNNACDVE
ncbi:MAG: hypothetical protein RLZZ292_1412, partial [Bacteroidota bacterium]